MNPGKMTIPNTTLTCLKSHAVHSVRILMIIWMYMITLSSGCATVGYDFPSEKVAKIRMNVTTQDEIRSMFGRPWRVGLEDGRQTWTYGVYKYSIFGDTLTKDLIVRFNQSKVVVSYTFNASAPR